MAHAQGNKKAATGVTGQNGGEPCAKAVTARVGRSKGFARNRPQALSLMSVSPFSTDRRLSQTREGGSGPREVDMMDMIFVVNRGRRC